MNRPETYDEYWKDMWADDARDMAEEHRRPKTVGLTAEQRSWFLSEYGRRWLATERGQRWLVEHPEWAGMVV